MAKESNEKKGSKLISGAVKISKYAKYLANPIVLWILLAIVLIIYVIGTIGFFMGLTGAISGWFSEQIEKIRGYSITAYDVTSEEVENLAKQLEKMGYDIENYGFVDSVEREPAIEGNTYINNTPQKGSIKSGTVDSKYLTAYLGEEKKMYRIAPENYSLSPVTEDYYLIEAIKKLGNNTFLFWGGNDKISTYYNNIGNYERLNNNQKNLYNEGKALSTYYFNYIKGIEIQQLNVEEQDLYKAR